MKELEEILEKHKYFTNLLIESKKYWYSAKNDYDNEVQVQYNKLEQSPSIKSKRPSISQLMKLAEMTLEAKTKLVEVQKLETSIFEAELEIKQCEFELEVIKLSK